mmetsp:Transcript_29043/g.74105  ORF Transcript_29043/g.74105 Transcript_29043/m.74105 type:complete len:380 (+) Transcript_29043:748-1887(+)
MMTGSWCSSSSRGHNMNTASGAPPVTCPFSTTPSSSALRTARLHSVGAHPRPSGCSRASSTPQGLPAVSRRSMRPKRWNTAEGTTPQNRSAPRIHPPAALRRKPEQSRPSSPAPPAMRASCPRSAVDTRSLSAKPSSSACAAYTASSAVRVARNCSCSTWNLASGKRRATSGGGSGTGSSACSSMVSPSSTNHSSASGGSTQGPCAAREGSSATNATTTTHAVATRPCSTTCRGTTSSATYAPTMDPVTSATTSRASTAPPRAPLTPICTATGARLAARVLVAPEGPLAALAPAPTTTAPSSSQRGQCSLRARPRPQISTSSTSRMGMWRSSHSRGHSASGSLGQCAPPLSGSGGCSSASSSPLSASTATPRVAVWLCA